MATEQVTATAQRSRGISFSAPMIRALLDGRKTQTRRVVIPQPSFEQFHEWCGKTLYDGETRMWCWCDLVLYDRDMWDIPNDGDRTILSAHAPYRAGDELWVREAWATLHGNGHRTVYRADGEEQRRGWDDRKPPPMTWQSALSMPREHSRITLRVTSVRVEKVQEITEADAAAEGIRSVSFYPDDGFPLSIGHPAGDDDGKCTLYPTRRQAFEELWSRLYGRESWDENQFVWVVTFELPKRGRT